MHATVPLAVSSPQESQAALLVDCRCALGEGIVWWRQHEVVLWTDIQSARLWMHSPSGCHTRSWPLPDRLGCIAVCDSRTLLLGFAKALYLADLDPHSTSAPTLTPLTPVEPLQPCTRINDGRCDRAGNFVFGTLNEAVNREPIGSFYQYSTRYGIRRLDLGGVAIPNSLSFSPDGNTMYYCDSRLPRILCCDYQADSAQVSNRRTFVELGDACCSPDGSAIDAEGCLWSAQWGASRIVRYTPQGTVDRVVHVPTRNPSCVTFGGTHLEHLYISSAREDLTATELEHAPESGGVYCYSAAGLRGLPEPEVILA